VIRFVAALAIAVPLTVVPVPVDSPSAHRVPGIVILQGAHDPVRVSGTSRRDRQQTVVRTLRSRAETAQRDLLKYLSGRAKKGYVSAVTPLWIVNAVSLSATAPEIARLRIRPDVAAVLPDRQIPAPATTPSAAAEQNIAVVNAPALWDRGISGQGVVVATLDTGVDITHPDLASRWRGGRNSWYDPNGQHPSGPVDRSGHGTATMGVLVGGDAGGTSIGMAPGARWIAVKIFNDRGVATSTTIHKGLQWLLDPDNNPATADAPDVVSNSWSMSAGGCNLDFEPDLENLRSAGILPIFSAGNYGPSAGTVLSPANNPAAFPVGAVDNTGVIAADSGRGPSACDQSIEPKLVAPGVGIHTADLFGQYATLSGTSLAAPHAAGALALLLSAYPELSADQQAGALTASAADLGDAGPDSTFGSGRLDALAAYQWIQAHPAAAEFIRWPSPWHGPLPQTRMY
jgi:subtilisin family serine protease